MKRLVMVLLGAVVSVVLGSCHSLPTASGGDLMAARAGTDRPLKGWCTVTVAAKVHDSEGEEGGCGGCGGGGDMGGGGGDSGGGCGEDEGDGCEDGGGGGGGGGCGGGEEGHEPPIPRHYTVSGECQLSHLGRVALTGRMNLTGPFSAMNPSAQGRLQVRGRYGFVAANGDMLGGSYVGVSASFTKPTGRVQFESAQTIGASCSDLGGGGGGGGGHDEPTLTGRFGGATGLVSLIGDLTISNVTRSGSGMVLIDGVVSY